MSYTLVVTNTGLTKLANANINGTQLQLTQFGVGDGVITPDPTMTALASEQYLGDINRTEVTDGVIVVDSVVPDTVGGWFIREAGIYDVDGDLFAIANVPVTYKVSPAEGSAKSVQIRLRIAISDTSLISFTTDETVIYATQDWTKDILSGYGDTVVLPRAWPNTSVLDTAGVLNRVEYTVDATVVDIPSGAGAGTAKIVRRDASNVYIEYRDGDTVYRSISGDGGSVWSEWVMQYHEGNAGKKSSLLTTAKDTLVNAINELYTWLNGIINDTTAVSDKTFSSSKIVDLLSGKSDTSHNHDADYLSPGEFGLGGNGDNVANFNDALASGMYYADPATANAPTTASVNWNILVFAGVNTNNVVQIATSRGATSRTYIRNKNGGAWGSWVQLWTEYSDGSGSGLNADTLDGYHLNNGGIPLFMGFNDTGLHSSYSGNLNDITTNSIYNFDSNAVTNEPSDFLNWGYVHTMMHSNSNVYALQVVYPMNSDNGNIWTRQKVAGTWYSWKKIGLKSWVLKWSGNTTTEFDFSAYGHGLYSIEIQNGTNTLSVEFHWKGRDQTVITGRGSYNEILTSVKSYGGLVNAEYNHETRAKTLVGNMALLAIYKWE